MKVAVFDYLTSSVIIRDVDKEYIEMMYDGDVESFVHEEVLSHGNMDNVYVMSDVEHLDIEAHFK